MALTYDIRSDIRFKQGKQETLTNATKRMLKANFSHDQIMNILEVSSDFIKEVAKSMKK